MNNRILLVEDDQSFGVVLRDYLMMNDFDVNLATDGEQGLKEFTEKDYDLCLFDVMMPKKDGFSLAEDIKKMDKTTPIIFLTAKNMREDILKGYQIGADDYITKPFDTELLLYKIKAMLQRSAAVETEEQEQFKFSNIYFDSMMRHLRVHDEEHKLSPKENELLKLLCIHRNDFMPRELALRKIWKKENYFTARSMDVYIAKLRKYLRPDEGLEIINVHGEGFRLLVKN
ncbi:response regulator transcription factor [Bergeyella cardium]|uniref:Response regulator n=1 Tax=Bergeyella cardium TaxID=1585976 RepID=A0A6P1QRA5_9FLAO|nr:response regulator transcription factor [Bergeyella cardium]QHN64706.1 response regulator [Bergeyella cardium]WHE34008.1 response regulator transcription factor [Bergeyella cardium]WHF60658.1 response regulator transcription factor [Bergeyella cardium]